MDKAYSPTSESDIYKLWEESGVFTPKIDKSKKPYSIILPLPNANDPMHMGHALFTIEDILEELVGEIEDEYDIGEENSFLEIPGQGWIIDAKMTLFDIAEQLGVHIPTNPEYETLGGYVYHCAGTIPMKGWRLSHDEFDLEVLSSNERSLKKIKILPRPKSTQE